ncbi:MAG TPA: hypothetical protein VHZ24_18850 [Pirellulales bacterium]|jgi:hypothetical protein|nr:hypothetical protein [Pirellulales bacterium]
MRRTSIVVAAMAAMLLARSQWLHAEPQSTDSHEQLAAAQLLVAFQGKGSALGYDLGVLTAAQEALPCVANNRVVLAGNSGGSILAVYFACHGITPETIDRAVRKVEVADLTAIRANEHVLTKMSKLLLNRHTELAPAALGEFVAFALGDDEWQPGDKLSDIIARSRCRPRLPLIIVAANREVLDNGGTGGGAPRNEKLFDAANYDVRWKPEVFAYYHEHPDEFAVANPDLRLGPSPHVGKACTYFVDRTMFDLLRQIPAEERLGDLRLVETPADLALAILASSAEPTYLDPVPETDYEKLLIGSQSGGQGQSVRRSYCGGFIMPLVAQDIRRALPGLHVMGTSAVPLFRNARGLLRGWYLVDAATLYYQSHWWSDFDPSATDTVKREMAAHRLTPHQEYLAGRDTAERYLAVGKLPRITEPPAHTAAFAAAIFPANARLEEPLAAGRGLASLWRPAPTKPVEHAASAPPRSAESQ